MRMVMVHVSNGCIMKSWMRNIQKWKSRWKMRQVEGGEPFPVLAVLYSSQVESKIRVSVPLCSAMPSMIFSLALPVTLIQFTVHLTHLREQVVLDNVCSVPRLLVEDLATVSCSIGRSVHFACYSSDFARGYWSKRTVK